MNVASSYHTNIFSYRIGVSLVRRNSRLQPAHQQIRKEPWSPQKWSPMDHSHTLWVTPSPPPSCVLLLNLLTQLRPFNPRPTLSSTLHTTIHTLWTELTSHITRPTTLLTYWLSILTTLQHHSTTLVGPCHPGEDPSQPNCDINLIINANEKVTPGVNENILFVNGVVRPGLFVLGLNVNTNPEQGGVSMSTIETRLKSKGVHVVAERDLASSKWACLKDKILPSADGNTLFLEDRECTLMRLWPQ